MTSKLIMCLSAISEINLEFQDIHTNTFKKRAKSRKKGTDLMCEMREDVGSYQIRCAAECKYPFCFMYSVFIFFHAAVLCRCFSK